MSRVAFALITIGCLLVASLAPAEGVRFEKKLLFMSPNEGCAVGDINNDGKPDIVAGQLWFEGPDWTPRPVRDLENFGDDFCKNNGDHLWDVDGDGWLDVITADWHGDVYKWFKNPGDVKLAKGLRWEENVFAKTRGQNEYIDLHDIDGDGVPEIFVSCWIKEDPQLAFKMIKDADGKPSLEKKVIGTKGGGHGYAFGDINGDGREDILTESGWYERPEGDVWAVEWRFHPETALPHPSCPCIIVDVNEDGRNDILWGKAHDFGLYYWEQGEPKADGETTWTEQLIDDSWSQAHSLVWADIDNDGACELLTGKRVRGHAGNDPGGLEPECVFYYDWSPTTKKFTRHVISDFGQGVGTGMQLRVVDLNGDDRLDIAVAGKTGTWVLINQGAK